MKKFLISFAAVLALCGFESLSCDVHNFSVENKSGSSWEIDQTSTEIKAYNKDFDFELTFYVDTFMPNSPLCLTNKRIKDIKFDIDIYKRAQKGDTDWAKMVERMRIVFSNTGFSEEKKVYGSNLLKNNTQAQIGEIVHIGTLQFLSPLTCEKINNMKMSVTGMVVRGRPIPPLEFVITLQ